MTHLIIGTAGHIDHGKTALVKALTGIECDTHPEEKRRGITINLGFAHLTLPSGATVGIVDVPGHRDFIHTMVAGASGIDVALLVIAADGGIMPQTREHMAIMTMLGVTRGVVALTRIDLVDNEILAMAREEVESFVKGTFLEGCPVVPVSSKTGEGIDPLAKAIAEVAATVEPRRTNDLFRMYIDRIFSVSGFGTVVTGSVLGGRTATGAELHLLPGDKTVRVRRIERYGREAGEAVGGNRASLNLVGLSRKEFDRGMMVSDRPLRSTILLDARVKLFEPGRTVSLWSTVQFFLGTFEAQVRMHLIDADLLRPGEQAVVQLHLPQPCVAQAGDRFVLRSTSNDQTVGGGAVIDAAPLHHRRRPAPLVEKLRAIAHGSLKDLVAAEIKKHPGGVSLEEIAEILNCSLQDIDEATGRLPEDTVVLSDENGKYFIDAATCGVLCDRIVNAIAAYHRRNPLDPSGRTGEELLGMLGLDRSATHERMLPLLLKRLVDDKKLKPLKHTWALAGHNADASRGYETAIAAIDGALASCGLQTPLEGDLRAVVRKEGIDEHLLRQVLNFLTAKKRVYQIEGAWLHASVVDPVRRRLLRELEGRVEGLTVAQFRDLIGANRKICLLLYALFDREGITVRDGDVRRITARGSELVRSLSGGG
ncbi:MAG: selenocysteine-specific translation elongation factor [Chitinispirillaceae bacterium]|nr:selenocysteine-specific translation elongation factor [Chitinispirillaceae bacterium]